jgi:3-deoxy-D-manno-octulosonate 8-phosphate phosphatase KdsC-like HAD superfamily phosphatase
MRQVQPVGERTPDLQVQNVLNNFADPNEAALAYKMQIEISNETVSYVGVYRVNGRPFHNRYWYEFGILTLRPGIFTLRG